MSSHRRTLLRAVGLLCLFPIAASAWGHEYYTKSFTVIHPWALPSEPGARNAAVYLKFEQIAADDRLLSAHSDLAERIELRSPARDKNPRGADLLEAIELTAGAILELTPGRAFLQLVNLQTPLLWGRSYPLTLVFEKSGAIPVMLSIGEH